MECQQLQKQSLLHRIEAMPGPHRRRGQTQIVGLEPPFLPFAATAVWEPVHLLIPDVAAHKKSSKCLECFQIHLCPFVHLSQIPDTSGFRV